MLVCLDAVLTASQAKALDSDASAPLALPALAPIDYYQFIGHELAAYEAEFQHIVRLSAATGAGCRV